MLIVCSSEAVYVTFLSCYVVFRGGNLEVRM